MRTRTWLRGRDRNPPRFSTHPRLQCHSVLAALFLFSIFHSGPRRPRDARAATQSEGSGRSDLEQLAPFEERNRGWFGVVGDSWWRYMLINDDRSQAQLLHERLKKVACRLLPWGMSQTYRPRSRLLRRSRSFAFSCSSSNAVSTRVF
jgi:hypothetical protein